MAIMVWYVPEPITGMVLNSMTCGIPVPNPREDHLKVLNAGSTTSWPLYLEILAPLELPKYLRITYDFLIQI